MKTTNAIKNGWKGIKSMAQRAVTRGFGWYAALGLLLVLLGVASYSYRNRNAVRFEKREQPPMEAMAVQTPDPIDALFKMPEPEPEATQEPLRFQLPLDGEIIGGYSPDALVWSETMGQWQTHPGIDIAAQMGEVVVSCADGVVSDLWRDPIWGYVIEIEHRDGYVSTYANLSTINLVSAGESVVAGQTISAVGDSADCEADMPWHLHFALEKDGDSVDFEALLSDAEA